jgi:starch synthase (maltosyl-transferring)
LVLLTNGIGGMARLCVDLGRVNSKYDCVLGANLNPTVPVDRHVFVKRIRVWVNADGFLSPLDFKNLASFEPARPRLEFCRQRRRRPHGGNRIARRNAAGRKTPSFFISAAPRKNSRTGKQLPADADVRLTVRVDIEDRNFHSETKRNGGADFHFSTNTHALEDEN